MGCFVYKCLDTSNICLEHTFAKLKICYCQCRQKVSIKYILDGARTLVTLWSLPSAYREYQVFRGHRDNMRLSFGGNFSNLFDY